MQNVDLKERHGCKPETVLFFLFFLFVGGGARNLCVRGDSDGERNYRSSLYVCMKIAQ
jgi:hypothetical protein